MKISNNILEMEKLAASQWGMFTVAQAKELGVQRNQIARMVDRGRIEPITYGVYRYAVGDESTFADVKGAWMSVNSRETVSKRMKERPFDAVVAGRTAASMHGIGEFYTSPYVFIVPARKQTIRKDISYFVWELAEEDVVFVDSLPVTSIERTVADLIRLKEDPDLIGQMIADAAWQGHEFNMVRLAELLAPLAARNGFKKNDGGAFARKIIMANAAEVQLDRASASFSEALKVYADAAGSVGLGAEHFGSNALSILQKTAQMVDAKDETAAKPNQKKPPYFESLRVLADILAKNITLSAMEEERDPSNASRVLAETDNKQGGVKHVPD